MAVANVVGEQIVNPKGREKAEVLYNPVDFEKYSSGNADNITGLTISKDEKIIEHIGIIHPSKRQDFTIRLIHSLNKSGNNFHAVIIGKCNKSEEEYFESLNSLAESLGVKDNIHFVGRQENVRDWLKIADAVSIPSNEGMSLVALETMASGCMVIATSKHGMGEMVTASQSGCLFDEDRQTMDEISAQILKELGNKRHIENGIKFAHANNLENYQVKIAEIFRR